MTQLPRRSALWLATADELGLPPLSGAASADVAVLGGGIAGLSTALMLAEAGRSVVLLEADRVGAGVTGNTTAKLTAAHGLLYGRLARQHGETTARAFAEANTWGMENAVDWATRLGIDCELERRSSHVWADTPGEARRLRREAAAAARAGLPARFEPAAPLPFATQGTYVVDGQVQFHPVKYLNGLARELVARGHAVHERTRALSVEPGPDGCRVLAEHGEVRAAHVVVATHAPITDRGPLSMLLSPYMSHALAFRAPAERIPHGMFINAGWPTRTLRGARDEGGPLLIVGGQGHRVGAHVDTLAGLGEVVAWARERFGLTEAIHRWASHDLETPDRLPFAGAARHESPRVHVATGFAKWGLTTATVAAAIITDAILGRRSPWARLMDPARTPWRGALSWALRDARECAAHFARRLDARAPADLARGEACLLGGGGRPIAAWRDEAGGLHCFDASCTHLDAVVHWNAAERTWDCPCHGSRFSAEDGRVLDGPAVLPLARVRAD